MSAQPGPRAYSFESGDIAIKIIAIDGVDVVPFGPSRRLERTSTATATMELDRDSVAALRWFAREIDLSVYTPTHGPGSRCERRLRVEDDDLPWVGITDDNVGFTLHMATLRRRGGPGWCVGPSRKRRGGDCGGSSDMRELFGVCAAGGPA